MHSSILPFIPILFQLEWLEVGEWWLVGHSMAEGGWRSPGPGTLKIRCTGWVALPNIGKSGNVLLPSLFHLLELISDSS